MPNAPTPIAAALRAQADRWPILFPLALLAGASAYMLAPTEPPAFFGAVLGVAAGLGALIAAGFARRGRIGVIVLALLGLGFAFGLGHASSAWRAASSAAPRLSAPVVDGVITGHVLEATQGANRPRVVILMQALNGAPTPIERVSISLPAYQSMPPGRAVRCRVRLDPPDGPMAPHGYDAARAAFFDRIGGLGFGLGPCRPADIALPEDVWLRAQIQWAAWRRAVSEAIFAYAPDDGGAIAVALITGDRSFMSPAAVIAFRDSGLGHMLSVSGLHMGLVGGGVFAMMWLALALIPRLALHAPIKKWAAIVALAALTAYLALSGTSAPAVRAYVMAGVAFGAILVDRPAISMRGLAAALAVAVLLTPEAVIEPGFQMSFAATAALVAYFELRPPEERLAGQGDVVIAAVQKSWRAIAGVLTISLVAGLATDPFALFHFQRLTVYGLPANLAAAPLVSFVIAPAAIAAALLAPFGLAGVAIHVMADALTLLVGIGRIFADRPEAVLAMAPMEPSVFAALIVGLIWLCVWRGPVRWLGALGGLIALAVSVTTPPVAAVFDGDGRALVVRIEADSNGPERWVVVAAGAQAPAYIVQRLGGLAGLGADSVQAALDRAECGLAQAFCVWRMVGGRAIGVTRDPGLLAANCTATRAQSSPASNPVVLVLAETATAGATACAGVLVVDASNRTLHGGGLIRATGASQIDRASAWSGRRVWSGPLARAEQTP